jgi:acyl carrier protein
VITVDDRARKVVADVLGIPLDQITLATSHESVSGWDSMNVINMMMAMESEFGVELAIDDAARFVSVAAILEVLRERGAHASGG